MKKLLYREFCKKNSAIPVFHEPWWLDAVSGIEGWDVALVRSGEKIVASLPYARKKKLLFNLSVQPPLTQTLGPLFQHFNSGSSYSRILKNEKSYTLSLIDQLPKFDYFSQNFLPGISNWLPWYWKGYSQTTGYTYQIENLGDLEAVWSGFDDKTRNEIRKAERNNITVEDSEDIDCFLALLRMTYERQGMLRLVNDGLVMKVNNACNANGARKIFIARGEDGKPHAGIFIVWNAHSAYYLMGGGNPALRKSGATSLALWSAIKFASSVTNKFDFEGSMVESIESFFRGFGGRQIPILKVSKFGSVYAKLAYHAYRRLMK